MSANNFLYGNGKERLLGTSSSIDLNDAETIATSKAVYELNKKIESTGRLPLGHFFLHPFPTPPNGCLVVNGGEYNRELYKDLWADVRIKEQYKSEAEWQRIASANGGYCPWYSDGNGSTTFRTPKFAPYQKLALASGDAGKYYSAGLPNITGGFSRQVNYDFYNIGVFYGVEGGGQSSGEYSGTGFNSGVVFDASRSSPIYGNSTTVTPESHDWIVCVVAFGTATNVGNVDVANVMNTISQIQAIPHIIETWKSDNGTSWYRKWSDGWIEQGGRIVVSTTNVVHEYAVTMLTFPVPFTQLVRWQCQPRHDCYTAGFNTEGGAQSSVEVYQKNTQALEYPNPFVLWYACGY